MPAYDATLFAPPAPVAHVTLRHPATGNALRNVAMLIDSGADVTLIPRESLNLIGVAVDPTTEYELVGFDGSVSASHAVQLDLLFLKRAFKGRFLVTDQSCGLLGRDILNHLAILLDGPRLTWEGGQPGRA
jgi:hypothetical protein